MLSNILMGVKVCMYMCVCTVLSMQVLTFCFGQDLQELVVGQKEKSWESESFRFKIIVKTYACKYKHIC